MPSAATISCASTRKRLPIDLHAAFEHHADHQLPRDVANVVTRVLEAECRCARDDAQSFDARERVDQLVGQRVAEGLARRIAGEVRERKNGDQPVDGVRREPGAQDRHVAALGKLDRQRIVAAFAVVVRSELAAQPPRLGADDRIGLGIEAARIAAKRGDTHGDLAQGVLFAALRVDDEMTKQALQLRGMAKRRAALQTLQRGLDLVVADDRTSRRAQDAGCIVIQG